LDKKLTRPMLLALTIAAMSSGCYRYVPADVEVAPPGMDVRMLVTRNGAREFADAVGVDGGEPIVNGTVVSREGDDLLVRVPVTQRQDGFITNRIEQSVRFPIGEIVSFQRRELNGAATGLLIGGAAAVVAGLVAIIVDPFGGDGLDPGDPDPPDFSFQLDFVSLLFGR